MTTYPSVESISVVLSSADKVSGSGTDFLVNLKGRLPPQVKEYYVRMSAMTLHLSDSSADIIDLISVHVSSLGIPPSIVSNAVLAPDFLSTFNFGSHRGFSTSPWLRCSNPNIGQVNVKLRKVSTGALATPSTGTIDTVCLALEFVPITYSKIAREKESYKQPSF